MSVETTFLKNYAVLWPALGRGDGDGNPLLGSPVEIRCRAVPTVTTGKNPQEAPATKNISLMVDLDIPQLSQIWLGRLKDLPTSPNVSELYDVTVMSSVPDIKGRKTQRTATLTPQA